MSPTPTEAQINGIDENGAPGRRMFASLSIKYRLPLLIGVLLSAVVVLFTWASYRAMKESSQEMGRERLTQLTGYLTVQMGQGVAGTTLRTVTAASDPAIRNFLKSPTQESRDAAVANVKQLLNGADQSNLQVEIWNSKAERVLVEPGINVDSSAELTGDLKKSSAPPFKAVGAIQIVNGVPAFPIVAATQDEAGNVLGYFVRWRKLSANPEARHQIMDIVGDGAEMYLGNAKGNLWTDLAQVAPNPPATVEALTKGAEYQRDGQSMMALARPIPGTRPHHRRRTSG